MAPHKMYIKYNGSWHLPPLSATLYGGQGKRNGSQSEKKWVNQTNGMVGWSEKRGAP